MEATGGYELDIAISACQKGIPTTVENPRRIKDFAKAMGFLNKTDRADARAIAEYIKRIGPSKWRLEDPVLRELSSLSRHRANLIQERNRIGNRLGHKEHLPEILVKQLQRALQRIQSDLEEIEEQRMKLVTHSSKLQQDLQALTKICGVGKTTALLILSEAEDVEQFESADAYAAHAGLNPCRRESGAWRGKTRLSKAGNPSKRQLWVAHNVYVRPRKQVGRTH